MKLSDNFRSISLTVIGLAMAIMAGIASITTNNPSYYYIALCGLSFILSAPMVMHSDNNTCRNDTISRTLNSLQVQCDKFAEFADICKDGLHKIHDQFKEVANEDDIQIFNSKLEESGHKRDNIESNCYASYFEYVKELNEIDTTSSHEMDNVRKRYVVTAIPIIIFLVSTIALCIIGAYTGMINRLGVALYFIIQDIILFIQVAEIVGGIMHYKDYRKRINDIISGLKNSAEICIREFKTYCSNTDRKINLMAMLLGSL